MEYETKDSGERIEFASGMVRDVETGKPRFDLCIPKGVSYEKQMLTRLAKLLARGSDKYGDRNWELSTGEEEMSRYRSSAFRHFMQWMCDENDEDHAAAVLFNVMAYETVKSKGTVELSKEDLVAAYYKRQKAASEHKHIDGMAKEARI